MKACYYAVEVRPYVLYLYETATIAKRYTGGDRRKYIGQIITENIPIIRDKGFAVKICEL